MSTDMVGRTPLVGINKTVAYQAGECISRHMRAHNIQRLAYAASITYKTGTRGLIAYNAGTCGAHHI